jgi:hypothetical protein
MRELRRAASPGRGRRGTAGICPRLGRRLRPRPLACGRCRARRPTPGGRPRYRQAGGDPPSRSTRHRAMRKPRGGPSSVPGIVSPGKFSAPVGRTGQSEARPADESQVRNRARRMRGGPFPRDASDGARWQGSTRLRVGIRPDSPAGRYTDPESGGRGESAAT